MTTITTIAQRMCDENGYASTDFTDLTTLEYLVKNAVDYVNMMTGTSISFTPAAGAASLTATDSEIVTVKFATVLLMRAFLDRGPNAAVSAISVTAVIADPQYSFYSQQLEQMVQTLKDAMRDLDITVGPDIDS